MHLKLRFHVNLKEKLSYYTMDALVSILTQNGVAQLVEAVICDFTPVYKLILTFLDINLHGVHEV
jgi:hypothetical protein